MAEEVIDVKAPAAEPKAEAEAKVENVGDLFKSEAEPEAKMVPESALLKYKKENKGLIKEVERLQNMVAEGATKTEVSDSLKEIAAEYKVDEGFVRKLSAAIKAEADSDIDARVDEKIKPIKAQEQAARIDKIFSDNFTKTLDQMPEYKDIANREVIKSLTLDPANANKTFAQIVESAYGHLVQGKRTIDSAKPRGGREPAEVDFERANKDQAYFKEIMADPNLRKEYNANLTKRLRL